MILYHGTNQEFDEIDLRKSKPNKDFGQGFYLSREYAQAMEMAKTKVEQLESGTPIVMTFNVDDAQMESLNVLRFNDYTKDWAKFILLNRHNNNKEPAHDYDVVIGPFANDRVGVQLWKFESHSIDLATLVHNLRNMRGITFQYYFGTERAIKILKRL
mgnify:FL=1